MIELDDSIPSELVPLSWLIGVWEGTGVVNYAVGFLVTLILITIGRS